MGNIEYDFDVLMYFTDLKNGITTKSVGDEHVRNSIWEQLIKSDYITKVTDLDILELMVNIFSTKSFCKVGENEYFDDICPEEDAIISQIFLVTKELLYGESEKSIKLRDAMINGKKHIPEYIRKRRFLFNELVW